MATTMTAAARYVYWESSLGDPMSRRIVPSHFNRDGKPKRGYVKEEVARKEAARLGMTYYRCDFCDRFHLSSKT
jgi:hypothetical protein